MATAKPKVTYKVQKQVAYHARAEDGRKLGQVWITVARSRNKPTAERIAQNARVDNPNSMIRIAERPGL